MARMIPVLDAEQLGQFRSRAEARFYEACRDQLPDDVVVIYSSGWIYRDKGGKVREGEVDFTILSPDSGVFAVEVKGGGVAFDPTFGKWFSVDRSGNKHQIKDPFRQASNERHALLDQLKGHPDWARWPGKRLIIGHAVAFPDLNGVLELESGDRPRAIIGARKDIDELGLWFDRVVRFWRQAGDDSLGVRGAKLAEDILCKSIEVRPVLRSSIDDTERQRIRLTNRQAKVLRTIGGRRRAVIAGGAGTGKTLIAVDKARQLAQQGFSVLFLCYNRPLAEILAISLSDAPKVTVCSFHQLCDRRVRAVAALTGRNLMAEASVAYPGGDEHRFNVQMPYALALSNELLPEKFDAIVIDEAQDFSDEYWFSIDELLSDQVSGHLYIFIDQNQSLYARHGNLPVADDPYYLTENCRNTVPIHQLGYQFYSGDPIDEPALLGPNVERLARDSVDAQVEAIGKRVERWVLEDALDPKDIVVLVAKRPKGYAYELIRGHSLTGGLSWGEEQRGKSRSILFDTVPRFKGLEAQAVVLWIGDEVIDEKLWELLYVGSTRAKSLLSVVGSRRALSAISN